MPLPPWDVIRDSAMPFALPLTRTFRGIDVREGVVFTGPSGWAEFAPFSDYDELASARWLEASIEAAFGTWPTAQRDSVKVNAIIPAVDSADAAVLARQAFIEHGCTTMKVKVGTGLAADEARVAAVRHVIGSHGSIRLDVNAGWSVADAERAMRRLGAYGIEYVEQPCRDLDDLAALHRSIDVPIAVDESLRRSADPRDPGLHARIREAADVVIVKVQPLGGVAVCRAIVDSIGLPAVVSGSLDSSIGLAGGLALAACLDDVASGLGTGTLLAADLIEVPLVPNEGRIPVQRATPDLELLLDARDRLTDDAADALTDRMESAYRLLEQMGR
jgi:o-succinylbenzoate synthase